MTGFFFFLATLVLLFIDDRMSKKRDALVIDYLKEQLEDKTRMARISAVFIQGVFKEMNLPYVCLYAGGRHYTITVDHKSCQVVFTPESQKWPEVPESQDGIVN